MTDATGVPARQSVKLAGSIACTIRSSARRGRVDLLNPHIEKGIAMNWDRAEGNWKQLKGKVREQWGKLTDDNLDVISGRREQLAGKIQEAYGISKDEAERQIRDFETRFDDDPTYR